MTITSMRDRFFDRCREHVLKQYPGAILDTYYPGLELLFYANERMEENLTPYSCHADKNGNLIIETEF